MTDALKIITLLLFIGWRVYWLVTERKADREKPKKEKAMSFFEKKRLMRHALWIVGIILCLQLLFGVTLLPMPVSVLVERLGFILVVFGLGLAILARHQLDTNWANAWEYQVKHKQELITTGVYTYIRNPIYTGIIVAIVGAELVAQSYLFLFFFAFFWGAYRQAKKEERILAAHFGKEYLAYKKRTKMLIPFII